MENNLLRILVLLVIFSLVSSKSELETLDDKVNALKSLPRNDGLISLDMDIFERYVVSLPRNFSFVFIIGSKVSDCEPCRPALEALSNIATEWDLKHPDSSELFFGFVDFALSMDLVKFLRIETAPFIFHAGPHQTLQQWDKVNQHQIFSSPSTLAAWISKVTSLKVEVSTPTDYSILYVVAVVLILGYIALKIKFLRKINFIASACLFFICFMLSGFMWVSIHSMPFLTAQQGQLIYIYPENRAQFGCECVIVMLFYAMTSGGLVFLTNKCPKFRHKGITYSVGVLIGLGVAVLGFNQMAECYNKKTGYLPFHFSLI